jgi:(2Fe-2S) ferredoxin
MTDIKKLKAKAVSRHIGSEAPGGGYERHVLFCVGGDCASRSENEASLKHLRKRLKTVEKEGGPRVYCTPVTCLQFCKGGPLAVVYPEGTWYHSLSPDACDRLVDEHIVGGVPVREYTITQNPLPARQDDSI